MTRYAVMLTMVTDTELRERDGSTTVAASVEHSAVAGPWGDTLRGLGLSPGDGCPQLPT